MPLVVQKFGGTSLADSEKILSAARKAVRARQEGNEVVVVVSAMGRNTDLLEQLAREVNEVPPAREMDMLLSTGEQVSVALMAMAIDSLGYQAVSLTGGQIGIQTDSSYTKARIKKISTDRIRQLLSEEKIVIAAGFQGIDENLNITTLGRGGSDTTAVALAAVLQADRCEIYTDVDGVYTTDPRILPEARLTKQVSYDEMLELASLGAGVMHSRSIEFGKKFNVAIHVRSSLSDAPGSLIVDHSYTDHLPVSGAALTKDEARISILNVPDVPGTIFQLFTPIAEKKITVDMIVQNVPERGKANISFTVPRHEIRETVRAIGTTVEQMGGHLADVDDQVAKVSVVGLGMAQQCGVANRMFRALAAADINLQMISTSEIKISVLVRRDQALAALRAVHHEFNLDQGITEGEWGAGSSPTKKKIDAIDVINRLQIVGMESLIIDDVFLDDSQSRITLIGVPNRPGIASAVFDQVAEKNVFVDMIVQSYAHDLFADISFTVPRSQFDSSVNIANEIQSQFNCARVDHQQNIAKLTVSGIGLRSHTGVALEMFEALHSGQINIEMISTSEVSVNVVIDGRQATRGLECLRRQFAAAMDRPGSH
jgi:aspartate kinase